MHEPDAHDTLWQAIKRHERACRNNITPYTKKENIVIFARLQNV
jgi:hypothetical protein